MPSCNCIYIHIRLSQTVRSQVWVFICIRYTFYTDVMQIVTAGTIEAVEVILYAHLIVVP